jgi:hypothetical protein
MIGAFESLAAVNLDIDNFGLRSGLKSGKSDTRIVYQP